MIQGVLSGDWGDRHTGIREKYPLSYLLVPCRPVLLEIGMKPKKPMKKPESGGKPKKITTKGKPGDTGPWGANPASGMPPPKLKR